MSSVKVTAHCEKETGDNHYIYLIGDFSSDAEFFVITCILSVLYTIGIAFVYVKLSDLYEKNGKVALIVSIQEIIKYLVKAIVQTVMNEFSCTVNSLLSVEEGGAITIANRIPQIIPQYIQKGQAVMDIVC